MSDEVKQAAERRRFYLASEFRSSPILVLNDCQILADAYLAEHPAERQEWVAGDARTAEILGIELHPTASDQETE